MAQTAIHLILLKQSCPRKPCPPGKLFWPPAFRRQPSSLASFPRSPASLGRQPSSADSLSRHQPLSFLTASLSRRQPFSPPAVLASSLSRRRARMSAYGTETRPLSLVREGGRVSAMKQWSREQLFCVGCEQRMNGPLSRATAGKAAACGTSSHMNRAAMRGSEREPCG